MARRSRNQSSCLVGSCPKNTILKISNSSPQRARRLRRELSRTNAEKCGFLPLSPSRRGIKGIRVKLSDLVGWHGQTLFVRAFLATHNGKKSTGNVAGNCPPLAGDQGGGKGTRKQCGKNQKPMKPIITLTTNGCDRLQTTCVRK